MTDLLPKLALTFAAVMAVANASAQPSAWPTKPISLVVPSTPGGPLDAYARITAEEFAKEVTQPVVVDNRAGGGGGLVGTRAVLQAPADGQTLLIGTAAILTINPSAYKQLPYQVSDFAYICKGVEAPLVLVANPSMGVKTVSALGERLKQKPEQAMYASYQPGTPSHFLGYQLGEKFKVTMTHVPYKGSAPQVQDLVAGNIGFGFTQLQTALPFIKSGQLVPLATTGPTRATELPDVPTLAESNMADMTTTVWFGLVAPKNTPKPVVERLIAMHKAAMNSPQARSKLALQSLQVSDQCGADFETAVKEEGTRWAKVVKATGFTIND